MDDNKLKKLLAIGYTITPSCGSCSHAVLGLDEFGTCTQHSYDHLKHTDETRKLSIHRDGSCGEYARRDDYVGKLGAYTQFMTDPV
jgi:hypothetical protein